jgi:simple sugar transport system permease protein
MACERRLPPPVWALFALGGLLLFNLGFDLFGSGTFFELELREGHLYGTLVDILNHGSRIVIVALGMTLVIATAGVDLSVGAVAALAGAVAATAVAQQERSFVVAASMALGVALAAGAWNGLLVARFRVQPIVATLVLMVAGRGIAQLVTDGQIVTFHDPAFTFVGTGHLLLPFPVAIVVALALTTWLGTRRTGFGLMIEAVGGNPRAAHASGVPSRTVIFATYVLCALGAGVAGLVIAANIKGADANHAGLFLELDAIAAVVVGGTALTGGRFHLGGTVAGGFLIQGLTTTLYALDVSAEVAPLFKALVIVAVCLLQSPELRTRVAQRRRRGAA